MLTVFDPLPTGVRSGGSVAARLVDKPEYPHRLVARAK